MSKARLEAFSDGVFAIAITLLVLSLAEPARDTPDLGRTLRDQWPGYVAYAVSFLVIGIMWINHHALFLRMRATDRTIQFLNLLLLMAIAFLPYPTGIVGKALQEDHGLVAAAAMYSATTWFVAIMFSGIWFWAAYGRRLLVASFPDAEIGPSIRRFGIGTVVYLAILGIAFISPIACLIGHAVMAAYYILDQLTGPGETVEDAVAA